MKPNNQYLEKINESVGGQATDKRKTNIYYLRSIAENTGSENLDGQRTDNYYLRLIALNMEDMDVKELLETIAELRGEVEELEGLLSNDIHLFGCKDIVQTGDALDLFAYCKHNGEVEGNTVHFYALEDDITDIVVKFTGTEIDSKATIMFIGENIVIDWGDGATTNYTTGNDFQHTYSEDIEHIIRVSNMTGISRGGFSRQPITEVFIPSSVVSIDESAFMSCQSLESVTLSEGLTTMGSACFSMCDSLSEITIPKSVTSMGSGCFGRNTMESINFLWDTSESIIEYNSETYNSMVLGYVFTIPHGTTALYEAKGYPSDKLQER